MKTLGEKGGGGGAEEAFPELVSLAAYVWSKQDFGKLRVLSVQVFKNRNFGVIVSTISRVSFLPKYFWI